MRAIKYSLAIFLCLIISLLCHKMFFDVSFSLIKTEKITLINRAIVGNFNSVIIFVISFSLVPLLYLLIQRITKIDFLFKGLAAIVIVLLTGIIFWKLHIFGINAQIEEFSKYKIPTGMVSTFDVKNLKFEIYLFMGFIIGTLISILVFKNKN